MEFRPQIVAKKKQNNNRQCLRQCQCQETKTVGFTPTLRWESIMPINLVCSVKSEQCKSNYVDRIFCMLVHMNSSLGTRTWTREQTQKWCSMGASKGDAGRWTECNHYFMTVASYKFFLMEVLNLFLFFNRGIRDKKRGEKNLRISVVRNSLMRRNRNESNDPGT